jgi:pSer/pThr/pTyr-binding forkhead associated (FHA) protein
MVDSSVEITKTGVGMGTPAYMSPEQGQGMGVDARSDIYSLGIVLFEMLTGRVPFEGDTPMAVVIKHMTAALPLPRGIHPDIPEPVERVILKASAKAPEDRYQTAGEMVRALQQALGAPAVPIVSEVAARPEYVEVEQIVAPPVIFPSVALLVVKGESVGSEYLLDTDRAVIGRDSKCDVAIRDEAASRQHAKLSREEDHFILLDLESANGTFVNGQRIYIPWELRDGDRIQIGETVLEFRELIGSDELSWQERPDRLAALQNDWQGAVESLHNDGAFRSHVAAIVANMSDSLGFKMQSQGEKRRRLISFPLDAPTLRLKIPPTFPALFLQREHVTPHDVEDLRDLIDDLGASNRFGLFIALQDPQETRSRFDETLRSMCDLVVLGEEDIARIVRMREWI